MQNPDVSGRLTKWVIDLREFDIKFMPRTTIKGQAIADFVVEFIYLTKAIERTPDTLSTSEGLKRGEEPIDLNNVWSLRIDGSSNVNGSAYVSS